MRALINGSGGYRALMAGVIDNSLAEEAWRCVPCRDTGWRLVYSHYTIQALLDGRFGKPPTIRRETRKLLRTSTVPCDCNAGFRLCWFDDKEQPPKNWRGYLPEQRYASDRYCDCPEGDVERYWPDFVQWCESRLAAIRQQTSFDVDSFG